MEGTMKNLYRLSFYRKTEGPFIGDVKRKRI
jgi:hypothetical protein